ncbi:hypothetical protein BDV25DRAFT_139079 [Aspergillus avenaceus]|uniref:Retrotransposon gag domain-containing protein n=1 Tax=Aspergillus avenaceus TaxID=36643 RepID=A0A5N6TYP6_ASPAV|nr:hypothetical protein BDV25DRAFT_139079 [Aspergillus avenaceus]
MALSAIKVDPFKGPATAEAITRFFQRCETAFEDYEDDNATTIVDRSKIRRAAASFADDDDMVDDSTKGLRDWYSLKETDLRAGTWDEFKDEVKARLLGPAWRLQIMKDFLTHQQDTDDIAAYIREFNQLRLVANRASNLPPITDQAYKYLLLFHSSPSIYERLVEDGKDEEWIQKASMSEFLNKLRRWHGASSGAHASSTLYKQPPLIQSSAAVYSNLFADGKMSFSGRIDGYDTFQTCVPKNVQAIGRLSLIYIYTNKDSSWRLVTGFRVYFAKAPDCPTTGSDRARDESVKLEIPEHDHLIEATFAINSTYSSLTYVSLKTAQGRTLSAGNSTSNTATFRARTGQQIVGFQTTAANTYGPNEMDFLLTAANGASDEHLFAAADYVTSLLMEYGIPYILMGGLSLRFRGSSRATHDVDIAVYCNMNRLLSVIRPQARIRRPIGPTNGVTRVFVTVDLDDQRPTQQIVGVDFILRGMHRTGLLGAPDDPSVASESLTAEVFGSRREFMLLDIRSILIAKLSAFYARTFENDYQDLVFLGERMGARVYAIRQQLNEEQRRIFIDEYIRRNDPNEDRIQYMKHVYGIV